MAKRKTKRKTTRRRAASSRGFSSVFSGDVLKTVGATAGGFVAANVLVDKLPKQFASGNMRMVGKAGIAIGGGMLVSKFANQRAGKAFAVGGLVSVALDVYNIATARGSQGYGLEGLDDPDGIEFFDDGEGLALEGAGLDGMGLGALDLEFDDVDIDLVA